MFDIRISVSENELQSLTKCMEKHGVKMMTSFNSRINIWWSDGTTGAHNLTDERFDQKLIIRYLMNEQFGSKESLLNHIFSVAKEIEGKNG